MKLTHSSIKYKLFNKNMMIVASHDYPEYNSTVEPDSSTYISRGSLYMFIHSAKRTDKKELSI